MVVLPSPRICPLPLTSACRGCRSEVHLLLSWLRGRPTGALLYMLYHEAVKWDRATGLSRDVMLADRFLDSIVAYQGQFLPADISIDTAMLEEQIAGLMRQIGIPIPDQTYLLDVSPELCAERFARREGRPLTDFELAQITQIRASFLALARSNSRIMVVDASDALDFFFNDTATTEIYTLSLHDALLGAAHRAARR